MISELNIRSYRGIKNLKLHDLGKVNIIAGANNAGKTSILEVLESLQAPNSLRNWRTIGRREDFAGPTVTTVYDTMKSLFSMDLSCDKYFVEYEVVKDGEKFNIKLNGRHYESYLIESQIKELDLSTYVNESVDGYETNVMDIEYLVNDRKVGCDTVYSLQRGLKVMNQTEPYIVEENVVYISPVQHARNRLYLDAILNEPELYEQFVDIIREFDPNFISINSVEEERAFGRKYVVLSKNHKTGLLLNAYGDGMKKAMLLLSAVLKAKGGVLLLDEFETAIHASAMEKVFSWIISTADKLNVQIFMTTHSLEAIEKVLKCQPSMQEDIRMITLVKKDEQLMARNVSAGRALELMKKYGLELR